MTKKERIIGLLLGISMLLLAIFGAFVFLIFLKTSILQWLLYNVCAPTEIAFFILFLFSANQPHRLLVIALPLICFGTMGLFIFPWSGQGAFTTQLSHILMTITAAYIIYLNREKQVPTTIIYWFYGVTVLIAMQQWYCRVTATTLKKLLNI